MLCTTDVETRNHLFFECSYAMQLWEHLVKGILGNVFTLDWSEMVRIISSGRYDKKSIFCIRYAFQAVVYAIWRVRNNVRHGEKLMPISVLKKLTDKDIKNKLSLLSTRRRRGM